MEDIIVMRVKEFKRLRVIRKVMERQIDPGEGCRDTRVKYKADKKVGKKGSWRG